MNVHRRYLLITVLGVAALRLGIDFISFALNTLLNDDWQSTFSRSIVLYILQFMMDVAGGALYALLAGRRVGLTLGDSSLGGAIVGFAGSLVSEAVSDVLLALLAIYWNLDQTLGSVVACSSLLNLVFHPLLGILLGGTGGAAVGLSRAWRSSGKQAPQLSSQ